MAARRVGISRRGVYQHREASTDFAEAWDDALEEACDLLEGEARRRAYEGTQEPVFYKGEECGRIRKYSDTLTIFLLKAHRPEKYRENFKVEHSGPAGGAIPIEMEAALRSLSDEKLRSVEIARVVDMERDTQDPQRFEERWGKGESKE